MHKSTAKIRGIIIKGGILMTLKKTAAMLTAAAAMLSAADTGAFVGRVTADDGIQAVFYVSPDGDDSADGSEGAPFATLERARDAVRAINGSMTGDIVVRLRGGDYRITKPVDFDTRDSGTGGFTVRYEACEGESPVINGAVKVTGWTKFNDKLISVFTWFGREGFNESGSVCFLIMNGYSIAFVVITSDSNKVILVNRGCYIMGNIFTFTPLKDTGGCSDSWYLIYTDWSCGIIEERM